MMSNDLVGVLSVYLYVAFLLIISEKILRKYPFLSRKFLHIMVGNILFMLPLFETQWIMVSIAAAPFVFLTFLMSPYSPLKIVSSTSSSGHGLGLVYYSISWTILAYLFFDMPEIIAIGIVTMSYGDGFASLIGKKYGRKTYNICGDIKSLEGSLSMFITIIVASITALVYFNISINILIILTVACAATVIEGITPKGLDNLTVSLSAAIVYYALNNMI